MTNEELGKRVQAKREAAGKTRTQLGRDAGLTAATVRNLECGVHAATMTTLTKIAEALGVSVSELMEENHG